MEKPAIPQNEKQRMACLLSTNLLDTEPEERFDRITRLAQQYFHVPITLISLVDKDRQWFKSKQGTALKETPREISFCGHAILGSDIFLIPDAKKDERFSDNPLVLGPPHIRFYAGMPLSGVDGSKIGTLCFIDSEPRELTDDDISAMRDLADCVEAELSLIYELQKIDKLSAEISRLQAVIEAVADCDIKLDDKGCITGINAEIAESLDSATDEVLGKSLKCLIG